MPNAMIGVLSSSQRSRSMSIKHIQSMLCGRNAHQLRDIYKKMCSCLLHHMYATTLIYVILFVLFCCVRMRLQLLSLAIAALSNRRAVTPTLSGTPLTG